MRKHVKKLNSLLKKIHENHKETYNIVEETLNNETEILQNQINQQGEHQKSWWESFCENNNMPELQNLTHLGTTFSGLTGISLTSIKTDRDKVPTHILEAIFRESQIDYVSIEKPDNHVDFFLEGDLENRIDLSSDKIDTKNSVDT